MPMQTLINTSWLQRQLSPTNPADMPRWEDYLHSNIGEHLLWYPSSSTDYRAMVETSQGNLAFHGFESAPTLCVYTDPFIGESVTLNQVMHQDENTLMTAVDVLNLTNHPIKVHDDDLMHRHPDKLMHLERGRDYHGSKGSRAQLIKARTISKQLGEFEGLVLRIPISNYQFFLNAVVEQGVRFTTMVKIRLGCGLFGGCNQCISPVYPWLAWAGCRQLLADPEVHFSGEIFDDIGQKIRRLTGIQGPPKTLIYASIRPRSFWSGYRVRSFRLYLQSESASELDVLRVIDVITRDGQWR